MEAKDNLLKIKDELTNIVVEGKQTKEKISDPRLKLMSYMRLMRDVQSVIKKIERMLNTD